MAAIDRERTIAAGFGRERKQPARVLRCVYHWSIDDQPIFVRIAEQEFSRLDAVQCRTGLVIAVDGGLRDAVRITEVLDAAEIGGRERADLLEAGAPASP